MTLLQIKSCLWHKHDLKFKIMGVNNDDKIISSHKHPIC